MAKSELIVSKQTIIDLQTDLKRQLEEVEVLKKGIAAAEHQLAQTIAEAEAKDKKASDEHALLKVATLKYSLLIYTLEYPQIFSYNTHTYTPSITPRHIEIHR